MQHAVEHPAGGALADAAKLDAPLARSRDHLSDTGAAQQARFEPTAAPIAGVVLRAAADAASRGAVLRDDVLAPLLEKERNTGGCTLIP